MEPTTKINQKTLAFANGDLIPAFGLGTWKSKPGEVRDAVYEAIKAGYRHIDCAEIYQNQKEVGKGLQKALQEGICSREELFITSKLWNSDHRRELVVPALERILKELQLEYLDLFLIHWPVVLKEGITFPENPDDLVPLSEVPISETWKGMAECREKGLTKHIGVSNFNQTHLSEILETGPAPEINQVELHPYLQQKELVDYCTENHILVTAYSPLGSGDRPKQLKKEDEPRLTNNELIEEIAQKHDASPFQILIAWALNRGTIAIPKSTSAEHIKSNMKALDIRLDREDMDRIAELDRGYRFVDGSFWAMEGSPYSMTELWGGS
jgi:alcohol dehydrogenase (NADP+)